MRRNNRKYCVALIAGIAAAIGVIVAIGVYLRKKASIIGEQLDFDPDMFDDDEYLSEEAIAMYEEENYDAEEKAVDFELDTESSNEIIGDENTNCKPEAKNFSNGSSEPTNKSE